MTEEQITRITNRVIALSRPAMRRAIGDKTPEQYDRADTMAQGIDHAVRKALAEEEGNDN